MVSYFVCSSGGTGRPRQKRVPVLPEKRECESRGRPRSAGGGGGCARGDGPPGLRAAAPAPPRLCCLGACSSRKGDETLACCHGSGVGANPGDPYPESCPGTSRGSPITGRVLPGPGRPREGRLSGQSRRLEFGPKAVCRLPAGGGARPRVGEQLTEVWETEDA